jgi:hypothetical protein
VCRASHHTGNKKAVIGASSSTRSSEQGRVSRHGAREQRGTPKGRQQVLNICQHGRP